jgi:hypothetical protein
VGGILVLGPGGRKAIPINRTGWGSYDAYIAPDGSYIIPAYNPLVRLGTIAGLRSDDFAVPVTDRTVHGTAPDTQDTVAAYGMVFYNDRPPIYRDDGDRRFWGRRVDPVYEVKVTDLGTATSYGLTALGGCRMGSLRALLFASDEGGGKARLVLVDGDGPLRAVGVDKGTSPPHLYCGKDAVFVTSVEWAKTPGSVVVVEARCAGTSCTTRRSPPVPMPAPAEIDAATFDGGVVLTWVTRVDQVTTTARGMAFYKVAALEALAEAPARPLFEGVRRGGLDLLHVSLVPRPRAALVVLETAEKEASTWAARIDTSGAATAVRMEETKW